MQGLYMHMVSLMSIAHQLSLLLCFLMQPIVDEAALLQLGSPRYHVEVLQDAGDHCQPAIPADSNGHSQRQQKQQQEQWRLQEAVAAAAAFRAVAAEAAGMEAPPSTASSEGMQANGKRHLLSPRALGIPLQCCVLHRVLHALCACSGVLYHPISSMLSHNAACVLYQPAIHFIPPHYSVPSQAPPQYICSKLHVHMWLITTASPGGSCLPNYGPWRPYMAPILVNQRLTAPTHFQDTRHVEFDISGSGLSYAPGDLLAVFPRTPAKAVDAVLERCGLEGGALVRVTASQPPGEAGRCAEVVTTARALVQVGVAARAGYASV